MAVTQKGRSQDKKLREREDLVRRSPDLSDGAKILWIELVRGWAWDDKECCPSQESIGVALGWSVRRVKRRLAELIGFGLLIVKKDKRHRRNVYEIVAKIPKEVCDPRRLINKTLSDFARGTESSCINLAQGTESSLQGGQNCPATGDETVPSEGTELSPKDEYKDELTEDELKKECAVDTAHATDTDSAKDGLKNEVIKNKQTAADWDDFNEMIAETKNTISKPRARKRRAANKALTGLSHLGNKGAVKPAGDEGFISGGPPPLETPKSILLLLRDEVEEKFGVVAVATVTNKLSGKEVRQLKTLIINKYSPEVIISMIRVLVWDWEVAREACWPSAEEVPFPDVKHLIDYRLALSGNTTSGFDYTGRYRGSHDTYANRYLAGKRPADFPF